ncbi:MAG TPA: sugar transferase [Solirubrobacteraceae bacterium]|nr:sugar transferase [Solirubrobacteraceae bacterium]
MPRAAVGGEIGAVRRPVLGTTVWTRVTFIVDLLALALGSSAATLAAPARATGLGCSAAVVFPLLAVGLIHLRGATRDRFYTPRLELAIQAAGAVSSAAMLTLAAGSIVGVDHLVQLTVRLWLFGGVYLVVGRVVLSTVRSQALRGQALATPTLILGAGMVGQHLVRRLIADPRYGLRPVGILDSDPLPTPWCAPAAVPNLGGPENLTEAIRQTGARRVILAFSAEPDRVLVDRVRECEELGAEVSLVPRLFEAINDRASFDHVGGVPLISLRSTNPRGWQFAIKHAFDRTLAGVGLILLAPLMGVIALGVRLSSPGPALFRQRRVGRDGRVFDVLKFRTMREPGHGRQNDFVPADGCAPGGVEGEDRRTRLGRWLRSTSLDEVPQLVNVLRGEMSLVGPRPERPQFAARFGAEIHRYDDRLRVRSGITGWAQVNGLRGQTSIADRVDCDNYYIRNWSLGLDVRIMMLTVAEVLRLRDSRAARAADRAWGIRPQEVETCLSKPFESAVDT